MGLGGGVWGLGVCTEFRASAPVLAVLMIPSILLVVITLLSHTKIVIVIVIIIVVIIIVTVKF